MTLDIPNSLSNSKNKSILLRMKENRTVRGVLLGFDIHMNLTLDDAEDISDNTPIKLGKILLRGSNLIAISLSDEK